MKNILSTHTNRKLSVEVEAAILCFFIAAVSILPIMLRNSGYFALSNDFIAQEIPFGMIMNESIKSGTMWNWNIDLGANYLEAFGFYNIGSPFFLLTLILPAKLYPKLIGWIFLLKFACSGATSSFWLKRHLSKRDAILIGAMLYTFSGAQCINIVFYHFQDVMALFPLMMVGLEELVEEGKRGRFALACGINMLCNPIFFFASAVFTIIYFVASYVIPVRNIRTCLKPALLCLIEGLTGTLIGAITAIPTFLYLTNNTRATSMLPFSDWFILPLIDIATRFMALFLPAESMNAYSALHFDNWWSWGAYIPLFGMIFALAYVSEKRDRFSRMIVICLIIVFIPILNSIFTACSEEAYGRWLFMADLIFACATAKVCEDLELYKKRLFEFSVITIILMALYAFFASICIIKLGDFILRLSVAVGCAAFFVIYARGKWECSLKKLTAGTLIACVALFGLSVRGYAFMMPDNTLIDFNIFPNGSAESAVTYLTEVPSKLTRDVEPYRYCFNEGIGTTYYNFGMTNCLPTINSFISTCHNSVTDFYSYLGRTRTVMTPVVSEEVNELLGARYVLRKSVDQELGDAKKLTNSNDQVLYLQEDSKAIPIGGIVYDRYITESEFLTFDSSLADKIMQRCMVVKDEDEQNVANDLIHAEVTPKNACSHINYTDVSNFIIGKDRFELDLTSDCNGYAFFSVPYDRFWSCTVNGKPVKILNVNGLMAVSVPADTVHILFCYSYSPMNWIIICEVIGILLCTGLFMSNKKEKLPHT